MTTPTSSEPDRQFAALNGKVLAYIGSNAQDARLADHADGAVFHGNAGFKEARRHSGRMLYAIDPELYAADRLPRAQERLNELAGDAVNSQVDAGASFLVAPSRFPRGNRGNSSIEASLELGHQFVAAAREHDPPLPAVVPIIVRFDELEDRRWVEPVRASGLPIATVFASYGDPLSTPRRLEGAIRIIQAARVACVLRCDMSTVGFMATGALFGALGTSSTVRHLYLPTRRRGTRDPARSIFVPRFANWMKETFVERALADSRLDGMFRCECVVCGENGDVRELTRGSVDPDRQDRHSIAAAVELADRVLRADNPATQWVRACEGAAAAYDHLDSIGVEGPAKPGFLEAWLSVLGSAPASATSRMLSLR